MWEGHPCPDTVKVLLTTCPDLSGCSERNGGTEGRVGGASPDIVGLFQSLQRRGCSINRHLPPWSQHGRYAHPRQLIPFLNNGVASSFVTTKLSGSKCLTRLPAPPLPHFPTFPPSHFLTLPPSHFPASPPPHLGGTDVSATPPASRASSQNAQFHDSEFSAAPCRTGSPA